jgi:hypothetical protein
MKKMNQIMFIFSNCEWNNEMNEENEWKMKHMKMKEMKNEDLLVDAFTKVNLQIVLDTKKQ